MVWMSSIVTAFSGSVRRSQRALFSSASASFAARSYRQHGGPSFSSATSKRALTVSTVCKSTVGSTQESVASSQSKSTKQHQNQQQQQQPPLQLNLSTIALSELQTVVTAWGHSKFRAAQIYDWVRAKGVTDPDQMLNLPQSLRHQLQQHACQGSLHLVAEQISAKDGTI